MVQSLWKTFWEFPTKIVYSRNIKIRTCKNLCMTVHSSFIHNRQHWEIIIMPTNEENKFWYVYTVKCYSDKPR